MEHWFAKPTHVQMTPRLNVVHLSPYLRRRTLPQSRTAFEIEK
jgi:hypothetical protein